MPAFLASLLATALLAAAPPGPTRKAVVVGIDRYDAQASARGMRRLNGAVADANAMAELLRATFRFDEVRVLADQAGTRDGIVSAIRAALVEGTRPGDVRVFYFSGHGSQVGNTASRELDKLDETIVPYDHATSPDLRDKELARELGAVVDRGGVLTVVLDSCHSGSGVRGKPPPQAFNGAAKVALLDPRTVTDPGVPAPPEERGALVVSAAQDLESALEVNTPAPRGALTFALVEALSAEGSRDEPARRVFLRAQQRMKAFTAQTPVLAGTQQRQRSSFFDASPATVAARVEVPVRTVDGRIKVEAGRAFGLGVGSILARRVQGKPALKLELTSLEGPSDAFAVVREGDQALLGEGGLFEVEQWSAIPGTNLVVQLPDAVEASELEARAADLAALRESGRVEWAGDAGDAQAGTFGLAWEPTRDGPRWVLYPPDGKFRALTPAELRAWKPDGGRPRVVATLPPPRALAKDLAERWTRPGGLVTVTASRPDAHYRLVGRAGPSGVEYAWVRAAQLAAGPLGAMPERTDYASAAATQGGATAAGARLADAAEALARSYAWFVLKSPEASDARFPYRLALRRDDGVLRRDGERVQSGETYGFVLEPSSDGGVAQRRWVYVFVLDAFGKRTLLFPRRESGDVENYLPLPGQEGKPIPLAERLFGVTPPYGTDTYFLLASETKLPNSEVLNEAGVRTRGMRGPGGEALPLDLLLPATQRFRGVGVVPQPTDWTLRRIALTSVERKP